MVLSWVERKAVQLAPHSDDWWAVTKAAQWAAMLSDL